MCLAGYWQAFPPTPSSLLAHQLPILPDPDQFWNELPSVFLWLEGKEAKPSLSVAPTIEPFDNVWQPPPMVHAWGVAVPLESVRFAAANHLCVNLRYQNSWRLIEPYALRRSLNGDLLLCAIKHETGEPRTYRVARIQALEVSKKSFAPRYRIELTPALGT
jgi:hypothetical protein